MAHLMQGKCHKFIGKKTEISIISLSRSVVCAVFALYLFIAKHKNHFTNMMCILLLIMLGNFDVTGNNMKNGHVDISNLVIGITSNCPSLKAQ